MNNPVTLGKHAETLKELQKQLLAVCEGIKKLQNKNDTVLKQNGLDPQNLKSSLEAAKLPADVKKELVQTLEQGSSEKATEVHPLFAKPPKTTSKRLNV